MDLNQMEANDLDGDTDDLWVTLQSMGFSDDLALDEVTLVFSQVLITQKFIVSLCDFTMEDFLDVGGSRLTS